LRETLEPQTLGSYRLRERSTVLLSPYWLHRHAAYWRNPERFDPARFDDGGERDGNAYLPFGSGPHACFGERFASLVARVVIARILARYRLTLLPGGPIEPQSLISLKPPDRVAVAIAFRRPQMDA
jgi:cytochrome P450